MSARGELRYGDCWLSQGQKGKHQERDEDCAGAQRGSGSSDGSARGGREAQLSPRRWPGAGPHQASGTDGSDSLHVSLCCRETRTKAGSRGLGQQRRHQSRRKGDYGRLTYKVRG